MLNKIMPIIRATIIMWGCILIPLFIGVKYIKSSSEKESLKYIDAFIDSEGVGLSKYIGLQLENTQKELEELPNEISRTGLTDPESVSKLLQEFLKTDKDLISVNMYHEDGSFFASSTEKFDSNLVIESKLKELNNRTLYEIGQLESGDIVVKYTMLRETHETIGQATRFFIETTVKWNKYETYMNQLQAGSFPRMFYITSPDCVRYVSLNSLPQGAQSKKTVVALGMHMASKSQKISTGLSNIKIDSTPFRIFKSEIKTPDELIGNKFHIIVAVDDTALKALSNGTNDIPFVMMILIAIWLVLCLVVSRFYNKTKEQLEIAETISDSTPLAIAIFRASDGKIMQINISGMGLLRVSKEDMSGINLWDIFISDDDKAYISNAVTSNINVLNYEVLVQSFGGASFWSICSASPIDLGDERYVVLAVLDINRRKEIEKKLANNAELLERQVAERTADLESKAQELAKSNSLLEKAKQSADEANDAKSKFLTNMSNELKTPINAIIGYSEILEEEALDRKDAVSADDLRKIIGSAKHLLSLIDEILDLSKIEAGKTQLFFENAEISGLIKDVESVTMPLIANNDNSLFLEYPKDIGIMYTDTTKLRQCLLNLLSNAAKFTEFGKVTLRATPIVKGGIDVIEFSVIDTGVGIQADRLGTIFSPFQESKAKSSGAGLGLSITKKYVEYLGGSVAAESELGVGSKFIIRVPRICTTQSNDFIEVKNQKEKEDLEQMAEETEEAVMEVRNANAAASFARKSDLIETETEAETETK